MQYIIYAIIAILLIIFAIQLIWATILVSPTWIMAISAGYLGSLAVIITIGVFVRFFSKWQSRLVLKEKLWTLRRAPLIKHEGTQTLIHCIGISVMLYLLFQYLRNSIESATDNQASTFLIYSCIIFINTIALAIYIYGAYSARDLVPDLVDWLCDYDVKKINELPALLPNVFEKQRQLQELVKAEFGIDWNPKIEQALRQE